MLLMHHGVSHMFSVYWVWICFSSDFLAFLTCLEHMLLKLLSDPPKYKKCTAHKFFLKC